MEYTLNEEQMKFLEVILGAMSNEDFIKLSEVRLYGNDLSELLALIDSNVGFSLYSELYEILYG